MEMSAAGVEHGAVHGGVQRGAVLVVRLSGGFEGGIGTNKLECARRDPWVVSVGSACYRAAVRLAGPIARQRPARDRRADTPPEGNLG